MRRCGIETDVPRRKVPVGKPRPRLAILRPLGEHLRRLRLERGLSQEKLAERAELNYKYIGRIELGKAEPGADVLLRLARALMIPVGEIFATITADNPSSPSPSNSTDSSQQGPHRLSPADLEALSSAVATLTAVANRIVTRQPHALPSRAPRRARR